MIKDKLAPPLSFKWCRKRQQRWALIQQVVRGLCSSMLQMFFHHSDPPLSQLLCMTVLMQGFGGGRSEQNRSDIKQRAAPSCTALEGSLDVFLNMEGLMAGRPNGRIGPRAREGQGTYWHSNTSTHKTDTGIKTHHHSSKDLKKTTHRQNHAHTRQIL